jgi:AcrR family transcriptional regulator
MLTIVNSGEGADRVLDAARRVLARDGVGALTMRSVGAEGGITATAIYRHFVDKDALLRALIRDRYDLFLQYLSEAPPGTGALERLVAVFERYVDFAIDHPNAYELLFVTPHGLAIDRYPADFNSGRSRGFRQLKTLVQACIDAGEMRDGDATDVALDLYAHVHGLVMLHRAGRFGGRDDVMRRFARRSLARLV